MTMIENVARAICDSTEADNFDSLPAGGVVRAAYMQQAGAAIEAMKEPTPEMLGAGYEEMMSSAEAHVTPESELIWKAMIEAALADSDKRSLP